MSPSGPRIPGDALLAVRDLVVRFPGRSGFLQRGRPPVQAVRGVSFHLERGETLGLVGESGSGKSTTARAVLRLVEPTSGSVRFDGAEVGRMDRADLRRFRRRAQIVFQDPYGSLNPRVRVGSALEEVLRVHGIGDSRHGRRRRVAELLERVGLPAGHGERYPHEFSGGQRQRIGIARALAVEPDLLICDEPVSALDVSVQARILNLLTDLQAELGLTYLLIAHDLAVVEHMSDRVAVMYAGRIVETAGADALYRGPRHPYTRALIAAVPRIGGRGAEEGSGRKKLLPGDPPSASDPPSGCPFHPRCPHPLKDGECREAVPRLEEKTPEHFAACVKEPADARVHEREKDSSAEAETPGPGS